MARIVLSRTGVWTHRHVTFDMDLETLRDGGALMTVYRRTETVPAAQSSSHCRTNLAVSLKLQLEGSETATE